MNSDCWSDVFQHISFEKRNQLSRIDPQFRNLQDKLKLNFESFVISDVSEKCQVVIDGKYAWSIHEQSQEFSLVYREQDKNVKQENCVPKNRTETLRKLVHFYLNRSGTTIQFLEITNHPYGLEMCKPLKVCHLKWKLSIFSSRYDYTTWFDCLRNYPIQKVEIDLDGEDYSILSEDVISSSTELCIKTRTSLPIQAIMNLKSKVLEIEQEISSEEILKLCERWINDKKLIGRKLTFEKSENQDLESIEIVLKGKYSVNQKTLEDGGTNLEIEQNYIKLHIFETGNVKISVKVTE